MGVVTTRSTCLVGAWDTSPYGGLRSRRKDYLSIRPIRFQLPEFQAAHRE